VILDPLLKAATSHVESITVSRTGINPLLWLVGLVAPLAMVLAVVVGDNWLRVAFFCLAVALPAGAFAAYFVLLFLRPDMLQSEEYRLRREAIIIFKQGASPEILRAAGDLARLDSRTGDASKGEPT
jgi:hypothetical protein